MLFNHRDQNYAKCYEVNRVIVREWLRHRHRGTDGHARPI